MEGESEGKWSCIWLPSFSHLGEININGNYLSILFIFVEEILFFFNFYNPINKGILQNKTMRE